ncbi:MAG: hypothetical protein JW852_07755 [Spirochaetales bacterium]|nr:hypothetical protein [Spirochaetales bacterium]
MIRSIAAASFLLSSCAFFEYIDITVELPAFPPSWYAGVPSSGYVVRYLEATGSVGTVEVKAGVKLVRLRIPRLPVVPVAASPVAGTPPAALKPCGGVFPGQVDSEEVLRLSWEDGFLAEVLLGCAVSGDAMQAVNLHKLAAELSEKSGGNPWFLNGDTIMRAIAGGTLSYGSLRMLPVHDVTIEAAPGRWVGGNPLAAAPVDCPAGKLILAGLTDGLHSYFLIGGGARIDISVASGGWTAIDPVTGAGSSGRW